jgi:hypothetical protein
VYQLASRDVSCRDAVDIAYYFAALNTTRPPTIVTRRWSATMSR